jgi:hypothetical protein
MLTAGHLPKSSGALGQPNGYFCTHSPAPANNPYTACIAPTRVLASSSACGPHRAQRSGACQRHAAGNAMRSPSPTCSSAREENEPLHQHRTLFCATPSPNFKLLDLRGPAAAEVHRAACSPQGNRGDTPGSFGQSRFPKCGYRPISPVRVTCWKGFT